MNRIETLARMRAALPAVAPSMLKCDFGNLHREFELLNRARVDVVHLDVMDGHFVPNLSYGAMVVAGMRRLTDALFDAHLMISEPAKYVDEFVAAGCELITFHVEAASDPRQLLSYLRDADVATGLALNPGTPIEDVLPFQDLCDLILVMSVEPGFGGQSFQPAAIEKLVALRRAVSDEVLLSVDGGIGPATIEQTAAAGARIFVAGSAIFDADDYGVAIEAMSQQIQGLDSFASSEF